MTNSIMKRGHLSWAMPTIGFFLAGLAFLSLSRGLLVIWQADRVLAVDGFWYILFQGIRFDLVFLAEILILPIIFIPLLSLHDLGKKLAQSLARYYFLFFGAVLVFLELVTPNFIGQYDFRPNILMME
jgi:phosphoglycerol transferase MdoB-like AlkP superfamily enzyme